jgi:hypothetical protein
MGNAAKQQWIRDVPFGPQQHEAELPRTLAEQGFHMTRFGQSGCSFDTEDGHAALGCFEMTSQVEFAICG